MTINLLASQIPMFWEAIKFAVKKADGIDSPKYFNNLLQALLNNKAQCFVRLSEDRRLIGICITRVLADRLTDEQYLYVQSLYSWKYEPDEIWQKDFDLLKATARKLNCKYVGCTSSSSRMFDVYQSVGLIEQMRIYSVRVD